ncbi:MAG: YihY/virulence factor BrkB family protein, partial [Paludibacteraceae bacterium]
ITYQPALDINKITVAHFFDMIDSYGSENFGLEKRDEFAPLWQYSCDIRKTLSRVSRNMLVKDI